MSNRSSGFSFHNPRHERPWPSLSLVVLALTGTWFGFANPWLHLPAAILLLPAALILTASQAARPGQAFRNGLLVALPGYSASLYWLAIPVHDYGGLPWALALPCPVLVGFVLALYAGLFCLGLRLLGPAIHHPLGIAFSAFLWASLELTRNYALTGFPWLTLSSALSSWPWAIGLAGWCGAFGLSGILVAMTGLALRPKVGTWLALAALTVLAVLPGLTHKPSLSAPTAAATLIQGNIDQDQKWDEAMQAATLNTYLRLSRQAVNDHASDLLVWPETAMPFYYQDPSDLAFALRRELTALGTPVLTGSPAYSMTTGDHEAPYVLHNRAYLIDGAGQTQSWYDKEHLVPFGEYVPLGKWLPFLTKLVPGEYEFRPGRNETPLSSGPMAMGVLICYEAIFPELAQKRVAMGANILVNISNDAWFGRSSAPMQHLHLAVLRAVEQNRSLIRSTNTGISVFIEPSGVLRSPTDMFTPATIHKNDIALLTDTTFYHDHFTLIQTALPLLSVCLFITCMGIRRKTHT